MGYIIFSESLFTGGALEQYPCTDLIIADFLFNTSTLYFYNTHIKYSEYFNNLIFKQESIPSRMRTGRLPTVHKVATTQCQYQGRRGPPPWP